MFSVFCFRETIYSRQDGAYHKALELVVDINAFNESGVSWNLSHRTVENVQRTKVGYLPQGLLDDTSAAPGCG